MAGLYDGIEEASFQATTGGYIFTAANPWMFGPMRRYFVSEAQKATLAACTKETLRRLKRVVIPALFVLPALAGSAIAWFGVHDRLNVGTWLLSVVIVLAPYLAFVHVFTMVRLRPLLVGLPRTSERIAPRDARANLAAHMPKKLLWVILGCVAVIFLASIANLIVTIHEHGIGYKIALPIVAVFFTGRVVARLGRMAIRQMRSTHSAG